METIYFSPIIENVQDDATIFSATNAKGYWKKGLLHIIAQNHFVYKDNGWYMRNSKGVDFYLAQGACPTIQVEDLEIEDEALWEEIIFTPTETNQEQEEV